MTRVYQPVAAGGSSLHANLTDVTPDQHHAQSHSHASHTGIGADDHHADVHVGDGAKHSYSGLTVGHVLKATAATVAAFGQLLHSQLGSIGADDHHADVHADAKHSDPPILKALIDALGDLIYGSAADTAARLAGNITTTRKFLRQTGDGVGSAAPAWDTIEDGDIPASIARDSEIITDHGAMGGLADDDHPQYATNIEFDDHSARHESAGADAVKLDDLAATDDNTDLNASTAKHGLMQKYPGGTTNFLRADGTFAAPPGGAGASWTVYEANLTEGWRGKFVITDVAISPTSKVIIQHAPGPYTGKGTRADEAEMDPLWCVAEPGSGQATVYWRTMAGIASGPQVTGGGANLFGAQPLGTMPMHVAGVVRGNVKFQYTVA